MDETLYIAAKAPRAGFTKTRLGGAIGHESAAALHKAFLKDLAARFADAPFALGWYVTPPDAWHDISPLVSNGKSQERVVFQREGDWTERQRDFFQGAVERGEKKVILIASDSPHLTVEAVEQAFRELERHDLVFGSTYDGGYYLIGMRGFHDVLHDVPMSTDSVLDDIHARAGQAGLSVGEIEATFDIDEVEDLEQLQKFATTREDLAATRAALKELGLHAEER